MKVRLMPWSLDICTVKSLAAFFIPPLRPLGHCINLPPLPPPPFHHHHHEKYTSGVAACCMHPQQLSNSAPFIPCYGLFLLFLSRMHITVCIPTCFSCPCYVLRSCKSAGTVAAFYIQCTLKNKTQSQVSREHNCRPIHLFCSLVPCSRNRGRHALRHT